MGIFKKIFSKEKKETLDKGLERTKRGVFDKISRALVGKKVIDDDFLDNLEEIFITSDMALALLLAGPSLSLPNMLVIRSVMGTKKTVIYVALVIAMATISGWIYGYFF